MNLFKRLFPRGRAKGSPPPAEKDQEEQFHKALHHARERLRRFLIARSVPSGVVKKTPHWTVSRTNQTLYKLEGEGVSILISTGPFVARKKDQITGLLHMKEADLNRALHEEGEMATFFQHAEMVTGESHSLFLELAGNRGDPTQLPDITELSSWEPFDIYQMIAHHPQNTLAHVLIHADPDTVEALTEQMSSRLKRSLLLELESLSSAGSDPSLNPHSRVRSLQDYEPALLEFRRSMGEYVSREKQKKKRLDRQKRLRQALLSGEPGESGDRAHE